MKTTPLNQQDKQFAESLIYLSNKGGLEPKNLASSIGVSHRTVNYWFKKERGVGKGNVFKICAMFKMSHEEMLDLGQHILDGNTAESWVAPKQDTPEQRPTTATINATIDTNISSSMTMVTEKRRVPLISWVQAGEFCEAIDNFQPGDADEWIPVFIKVSENTFALTIQGDSMAPEFQAGEVIIVDPAVEPETGKYVVARVSGASASGFEATFKQLIKDAGRVYLKPLNPAYPLMDMTDREDFVVCGCVVQKTKTY